MACQGGIFQESAHSVHCDSIVCGVPRLRPAFSIPPRKAGCPVARAPHLSLHLDIFLVGDIICAGKHIHGVRRRTKSASVPVQPCLIFHGFAELSDHLRNCVSATMSCHRALLRDRKQLRRTPARTTVSRGGSAARRAHSQCTQPAQDEFTENSCTVAFQLIADYASLLAMCTGHPRIVLAGALQATDGSWDSWGFTIASGCPYIIFLNMCCV